MRFEVTYFLTSGKTVVDVEEFDSHEEAWTQLIQVLEECRWLPLGFGRGFVRNDAVDQIQMKEMGDETQFL